MGQVAVDRALRFEQPINAMSMEKDKSMEAVTLPATRRTHLGTKHTRRVRDRGQTPAVIYGHGEDPVPVVVDAHEVESLLARQSRVVTLDLEGQTEQFLIKAVQYDHLDARPIHLDLMRVDADESVQVSVEVVLRGTAAGTHEGGVLMQLITQLDIECVVTAIPDEIRCTVTHLDIGDSLVVGDLELPEGVSATVDKDEKVAICRMPTETAEEEETDAEGAEGESAQPEMIGKGKDDEASEDKS